jgi:hypothetical protein
MSNLTYIASDDTTFDLDDGVVYRLKSLPQGFWGLAVEPSVRELALGDIGGFYEGHIFRKRELDVVVQVFGNTRAEAAENARALIAALSADVRRGEQGRLRYTAPSGVTRDIYVILRESFDLSRMVMGASGARTVFEVTLPFLSLSRGFYDTSSKTATGTFNGTTSVYVFCDHDGDVDAWPTITYTGTSAQTINPKVTDAYGYHTQVNVTLSSGDTLEMTFWPLSIIYTPNGGSATDYRGYRTSSSREIRIKPGDNPLTFVCGSGSGTASISVTWNDIYSSHG